MVNNTLFPSDFVLDCLVHLIFQQERKYYSFDDISLIDLCQKQDSLKLSFQQISE